MTAKTKAEAKKTTSTSEPKPNGRPPSEETLQIRKRILVLAKKGITGPEIAAEVERTTLQIQAICTPLLKQGLLKKEKSGRVNIYTTV